MHEERLWQAVLGDIEITLSRGNYLTWFKNTRLIECVDGSVVVGVGNIFIKNHLQIIILNKPTIQPSQPIIHHYKTL